MAKTRTSTSSPARAEWTVMVYLAGDNNLTDECTYSLTEMKKAGPLDHVKIIAQFDPRDPIIPTQRYKIEKNIESGTLAMDMIGSLPAETNTGDPKTLRDFISFCIDNYSAYHYMVVLSGHGAGVESDFLMKDDSPAGFLTIPELKGVFDDINETYKGKAKEGKDPVIDILGMDVCLMSMAEICYELKDSIEVLVGCESYSPAAGWPYRQILEGLESALAYENSRGRSGAKGHNVQIEFSKAIVEEFVNFYADYSLGGLSVDASAMKVAGVNILKNVVKNLAKLLIARLKDKNTKDALKDAIILAHWEAQSYNGELFVDLHDFCDCLQRRYAAEPIHQACEDIMNAIDERFVLKSCTSGPAYQYSNGVSIYFPWANVAPDYKRNLDFAQDSMWGEFLEIYTNETRRAPRPPSDRRKASSDSDAGDARLLRAIEIAASARLAGKSAGKGSFSASAGTNPPGGARPFRKVDDRKVDDRGANPVQSMRNPPIVAFPDDCIKRKEDVIRGLKKLFLK